MIGAVHRARILQKHVADPRQFDVIAHFAKHPSVWRRHLAQQYGIPEKSSDGRNAEQLLLALQYGDPNLYGPTVRSIIGSQELMGAALELAQQFHDAQRFAPRSRKEGAMKRSVVQSVASSKPEATALRTTPVASSQSLIHPTKLDLPVTTASLLVLAAALHYGVLGLVVVVYGLINR